MPNINKWLSTTGKAAEWKSNIEGAGRSQHFTNMIINGKPISIVIQRNDGTTLDAQTVRLEMTRIQPDRDLGRSAREAVGNFVAIGYKDHPTEPDFDVQAGDKFAVALGDFYVRFEVRMVYIETPGETQAWLEIVE